VANPAIIRLWENAWEEFIPFLDYDGGDPQDLMQHQRHRKPERPLPARGQGPWALPHRAGCHEVPVSGHPIPRPQRHRSDTLGNEVVESAWGAVPALLPVCFPGPLAEPGVRLSTHPALHGQLFGGVRGR
jgi:hypothetical protein